MLVRFRPDSGEFWIGKQTIWNLPVRRYTLASGEIRMDYAKVVNADVRELRAACNLADRPNAGGGCLEFTSSSSLDINRWFRSITFFSGCSIELPCLQCVLDSCESGSEIRH